MADAKISALTALSTQATTDLYETSANGTGSFKETRAQQLAYFNGAQYPKDGCRVATTAALTVTYANGTAGVGATLTNAGTQAAISIDGVTLAAGDRVLVKDQSSQLQNGIYTVTTLGSGATNWVMTRAVDFNAAAKISVGDYTVVAQGTANAGKYYVQNATGPFTLGSTAITFITSDVTSFSPQNNVYVSKNGSNTTGDGTQDNPYADPFAATTASTGTSTNPILINVAPGQYSTTDFGIKPLVSYISTLLTAMIVSNPVTLNSAWSAASNGAVTDFYRIALAASVPIDFSAATATSLGLRFFDSVITSAFAMTGQDSNQITLVSYSTRFIGAITLKSLIAKFNQGSIESTLTIADKGSGSGTTTVTLVGTPITGNVSVSGASGRASTVTFTGSPIAGSLTVDTTFVTISIDESSFPVGGITYTNGATSAQVSVIRGDLGSSIPLTKTAGKFLRADGTNYLETTATFADTYTASNILYSNGANTVTGLATANAGVLRTSTSGVPSILSATDATGRALLGNTTTGLSWSAAGYPNTGTVAGQIIYFNGTNFIGSTIKWTDTAGSTGSVLRYSGAGSGGVYSTATFADTYSVSTILYASSSNTITGLATANSSFLQTDSGGIPGWQTAATTRTNLSVPGLATNNAFTAQNGTTPAAITSTSAAVAWDLNSAPNATHAATENTTLSSATNQVAGNIYTLKFVQNGSAAKTFAFNGNYKFPSGVVPIVSTGLSAVDIYTFYSDGTNMRCIGIAQNIS